jgi:hypothetical protein
MVRMQWVVPLKMLLEENQVYLYPHPKGFLVEVQGLPLKGSVLP